MRLLSPHRPLARGVGAAAVLLWMLPWLSMPDVAAAVEHGTSPRSGAETLSLTAWVETELVPQMVDTFTTHPRFRSRPLQVVVVQGSARTARSDGLSIAIRDALREALDSTSNSRVIPEAVPGSGRADCLDRASVEYWVTVEVEARDTDEARVSVRVLDLMESTWVGGFGARWQGRLTSGERRRLSQSVTVESARGQRQHPFLHDQTDLLAAALAADLGCALTTLPPGRVPGEGSTRIYLEPSAEVGPELQKAALLVLHQLAHAHSLQHVDSPAMANLHLRLHLHRVTQTLVLYWLTLERRDPLGLTDAAMTEGGPPMGSEVLAKAQAYVAGELLPAALAGASMAGRADYPDRVLDAARPASGAETALAEQRRAGIGAADATSLNAASEPAPPPRLLAVPRLVSGTVDDGCPSQSARRAPGGSADSSPRRRYTSREPGCQVVEVDVAAAAEVYLLWAPARCRLDTRNRRQPRVQHHATDGAATVRAALPAQNGQQTLYSVYVIAVAAGEDSAGLRRLLADHPGDYGCDSPRFEQSLRRWSLALESSLHVLGPGADWQALRVTPATLASLNR
jgi:hypothetical protein